MKSYLIEAEAESLNGKIFNGIERKHADLSKAERYRLLQAEEVLHQTGVDHDCLAQGADEVLTMLCGEDALKVWAHNEPDPADLQLWAVITTDDDSVLFKLRAAGWSLKPAPAGNYPPNAWSGLGCRVLSDGGEVEEGP